jgi:hypothetical protein
MLSYAHRSLSEVARPSDLARPSLFILPSLRRSARSSFLPLVRFCSRFCILVVFGDRLTILLPVLADAGSEATPIIGQTENDKDGKPLKTTQKTNKVLPDTIIYDIDLTLTLPAQMTVRFFPLPLLPSLPTFLPSVRSPPVSTPSLTPSKPFGHLKRTPSFPTSPSRELRRLEGVCR